MNKPSSCGLSFAVSSDDIPSVKVCADFALYVPEIGEKKKKTEPADSGKSKYNDIIWRRRPIRVDVPVNLEYGIQRSPLNSLYKDCPDDVFLYIRVISWEGNKRLATITLVNDIKPEKSLMQIGTEMATLFQVSVTINPAEGTELIARPSGRGGDLRSGDRDDRIAALLYRDYHEFATGHTCSAAWDPESSNRKAEWIATAWIPEAIVPSTSSSGHHLFNSLKDGRDLRPLSAEWLSHASDRDLKSALLLLPDIYEKWLVLQDQKAGDLQGMYQSQASENLAICRGVLQRIREGAEIIADNPEMADTFRLVNRAIVIQYGWSKKQKESFFWRPFQLAFLLLTIPSTIHNDHPDRNIMDLLWFPTGGGKTEAYLALVAFTIIHRRIGSKNGPDSAAGVAAIMRYTLRLLTTQQFSRSASVILACEMIRRGKDRETPPEVYRKLGDRPISIGLWVGGGATPNNFNDARKALEPGNTDASPEQLEVCPACKEKLVWGADMRREEIHVSCRNDQCLLYHPDLYLPVYTTDSDIYRERPSLVIGTVDKFAQIVRRKELKFLFSTGGKNPPDLIIQDELHLISGPLGTIAGLYETAIDRMFSRGEIPPKVIGSTATIRRAAEQARALFNRETCQFPPPAIDADDSGFAVTDYNEPGRKYVAVSTTGRSAKFTLQAVSASLLQSGQCLDEATLIDYYWTLLSYYNSLRELGGALVLMQDDVSKSIFLLAKRHGETVRPIHEPEELTSRRTQEEIRKMLDTLEIPWSQPGAVDTVLATNMVSVGVDISRLGLMVVNGQPKSISEYIQATSRVGRGKVPGLIVSILNNAKPRDRSHYESFQTWHNTLYRDVEATSVTPFAPRAREKALHSTLVGLVRLTVDGMLDHPDIRRVPIEELTRLKDYIVRRAKAVDPEETTVADELDELIEEWEFMEPHLYFAYNDKQGRRPLLQDAEYSATLVARGYDPGDAWPVMNNMRSVEPSTPFRLVERLRSGNRRRERR